MARDRRFSVAELVERLQDDSRLRQRAAALAGACVFFAAALAAVGLGLVVLVVAVAAALAGVLALTATRARSARERLSTLARRTATKKAGAIPPPTAEERYGWPYAGSDDVPPAPHRAEPRVDEERRRGVELNARGTNLRRAGSPADAAALHLEALEIFRSLDDARAQATTLNSLALALAGTGETAGAVERFEQSLSLLRDRPDDPGRGAVIANLGLTLLRQGEDERARELLAEALEKLPPESRAAHTVEARLRRAS